MATGKLREVLDEFRTVVLGQGNLLDTVLPPVVFVIVNALLGFQAAMGAALMLAAVIAVVRWRRHQSLLYAFGGVLGVLLAIAVAQLLGRAEGFFLPSMLTGGFTAALCLVSILARRPAVAWTSYVSRRWPLNWYWHPKVRPAYSEVTAMWALFFGARLLLQLGLFRSAATGALATVNLLMGWPALILLLFASYMYGTWRLRRLGGPSVEEFKQGLPAPWQGQQRGF